MAVLPPVETGPPVQAYFCPEDDCNAVIFALFSNATDIQCAFYSLDVPDIHAVLQNATLVVDNSNLADFAGLDIVADKTAALMHNKFCVLDKKTVITGSYNPTTKSQRANDLIVVPSAFVAKNYLAEFQEMRSGVFGRGSPVVFPAVIYNNATIQTAFCPEDDCAEKTLAALRAAKESIRFMLYSFTDDEIGDFLASSQLKVEGVFDSSQLGKYSEQEKLSGRSAVRKNIHHKVFIIDNTTVITGSYNPTKNGNERNDENLLIIHDANIARLYNAQFEKIRSQSPLLRAPNP